MHPAPTLTTWRPPAPHLPSRRRRRLTAFLPANSPPCAKPSTLFPSHPTERTTPPKRNRQLPSTQERHREEGHFVSRPGVRGRAVQHHAQRASVREAPPPASRTLRLPSPSHFVFTTRSAGVQGLCSGSLMGIRGMGRVQSVPGRPARGWLLRGWFVAFHSWGRGQGRVRLNARGSSRRGVEGGRGLAGVLIAFSASGALHVPPVAAGTGCGAGARPFQDTWTSLLERHGGVGDAGSNGRAVQE